MSNQIDTPSSESMRRAFEQWYIENAFDYPSHPIGSRDCYLQWESWKAGVNFLLDNLSDA